MPPRHSVPRGGSSISDGAGAAKIRSPFCDSYNILHCKTRKSQPSRCRECRKMFNVKTDTLMRGSNPPLSNGGIAIYLYSTDLKGLSSMKLHHELGITQKSAWYHGATHPGG